MEPKIKKMSKFLRCVTFGWPIAITLAPFGIYIKEEFFSAWYRVLINHEKIHWNQQVELLIIFFYVFYCAKWFVKIFIYGKKAYLNISFEREANEHERNLDYLGSRKRLAWFKYIL